MRIATGIRTIHSNPDSLQRSVQSAQRAGLGESLHLFTVRDLIETESFDSSLTVILRTEQLDDRTDFILSLAELYQREPQAELYVLLSNDILLCKDIGPYLRKLFHSIKVASLFTSGEIERQIERAGAGFQRLTKDGEIPTDGDAWVISNALLRELLRSDLIIDAPQFHAEETKKSPERLVPEFQAKSILAAFCQSKGHAIQFHFPSLGQRVTPTSSTSEKASEARFSAFFPGEDAAALQYLPTPPPGDLRSTETCVILVPIRDAVEQECEAGLKELERNGYVVWRVNDSASMDQVRSQLATDALREGFTETMWIDPTIAFRAADVERLRSHGVPIACGLYPEVGKRSLTSCLLPGVEEILLGRDGELSEILYAAAGFLHVRREAYDAVQSHLNLPTCSARSGKTMIPFFQPMILEHPTRGTWYLPEDFAFSERTRMSGLRVMADATIRLKHIGRYGFSWEDAGATLKRYSNFTLRLQ